MDILLEKGGARVAYSPFLCFFPIKHHSFQVRNSKAVFKEILLLKECLVVLEYYKTQEYNKN